MDASNLTQLTAELLVAVQLLLGQPSSVTAPSLEFVPNTRLVAMACDGPCDVRGWYPGGDTIYLDEGLDPAGDFWDRSVLVHELVHYLQEQSGAFGIVPTCRRWLEREGEAYDVQRRWLRENRPRTAAPRYLRFGAAHLHCGS